MAKPISTIRYQETPKEMIIEQNLQEIQAALSEHKSTVLQSIDMMAALEESGLLDIAEAMIKQRKAAMKNIITELNKPQYAGSLENISNIFFLLGALDMEMLQEFTEKINQGMIEALDTEVDEKTTFTGLIKTFRDPEVNRGITMLLQFLKGMGKET
ncbi:DUF1641 domain-containing protein [Ornithinibacillus gellani]|uniref:DUF1641 domain-containing protein n=1 Tax=Ornithinibacillus gellani TaxID=2293253 RepID=UPI0016811402|nr:DUF1641 domain-containing protein [Ornithinibacillus gellani]